MVLCPPMAQKHHRGGRTEVLAACCLQQVTSQSGLPGPWSPHLAVFFCNPHGFPFVVGTSVFL